MIIALLILIILLCNGNFFGMLGLGLTIYISLLLIVSLAYTIFGKKYKYLPFMKRFNFYFLCICGARKEPKDGERV